MTWFRFSVRVAGKLSFIGRCQSTVAEIRKALPWSTIEGNHVIVFGPPPKGVKA